MKKSLLILLALLCTAALWAQGTTLQDAKEDSVINVVAYFCKNDTTVYTSTSKKWKVIDGDTTKVYQLKERFRLVVTDSTSDGYKLEYTPLSYHYDGDADRADNALMGTLWNLTKDIRAIFVTDEMGTIQHLENWREVRDAMKKSFKTVFDTLYADNPGMDSIIPRKRFEATIMLIYNTEENIIGAYEDMGTLFGLHGRQLNIGTTEADDNSSYPAHTRITTGYEDYPDEEQAFDGDFSVAASTVTTVSKEETVELVGNVFGVLMEDSIASKVDQVFKENLKENVKDNLSITNLEDYHYFFNGWPRLMRTQKVVKFMTHQQVEEQTIEWGERSWNVYGSNEAEAQKSL